MSGRCTGCDGLVVAAIIRLCRCTVPPDPADPQTVSALRRITTKAIRCELAVMTLRNIPTAAVTAILRKLGIRYVRGGGGNTTRLAADKENVEKIRREMLTLIES